MSPGQCVKILIVILAVIVRPVITHAQQIHVFSCLNVPKLLDIDATLKRYVQQWKWEINLQEDGQTRQ